MVTEGFEKLDRRSGASGVILEIGRKRLRHSISVPATSRPWRCGLRKRGSLPAQGRSITGTDLALLRRVWRARYESDSDDPREVVGPSNGSPLRGVLGRGARPLSLEIRLPRRVLRLRGASDLAPATGATRGAIGASPAPEFPEIRASRRGAPRID